MLFKSSISVSYSFPALSNIKPRWFSKLDTLGAHLLGAGPRAGEPDIGLRPLAS